MEKPSDDELCSQVLSFLNDFKELIGQGQFLIKDHYKNRQALIDLGITYHQREDYILALAIEHYSAGPIPDQYKPGQYWVFGKEVDGNEVYIKLKIVTKKNGDEYAICFSFHPSDYPLDYPLN